MIIIITERICPTQKTLHTLIDLKETSIEQRKKNIYITHHDIISLIERGIILIVMNFHPVKHFG